ncbi:MAG: hypothetical protein RR770_00135, partial [Bacteroidales bacterium]
ILFSIIVLIMFYTSSRPAGTTVFDLFKEGSGYQILAFFLVFAGVYPLVGFQKKKVYVNNFADKKTEIIELFNNANFIVYSQTPTTITFRLKNKFLRIIRMCEDHVTIDFSDNPILVDGLRKDVLRFSRGIEYICQKDSE